MKKIVVLAAVAAFSVMPALAADDPVASAYARSSRRDATLPTLVPGARRSS